MKDTQSQNPSSDLFQPSESHSDSEEGAQAESGHQFVESRLHQKIHINKFSNKMTGAPINANKQDSSSGFKKYGSGLDEDESNIYAPFKSRLDWEIAHWAKFRGPSSTALTELLNIAGVQHTLGLSFKNAYELNSVIDIQLPSVRPRFIRQEIILTDTVHILYYCDILACIQALYGAPELAQYLVFVLERHYADANKTIRVYYDMLKSRLRQKH